MSGGFRFDVRGVPIVCWRRSRILVSGHSEIGSSTWRINLLSCLHGWAGMDMKRTVRITAYHSPDVTSAKQCINPFGQESGIGRDGGVVGWYTESFIYTQIRRLGGVLWWYMTGTEIIELVIICEREEDGGVFSVRRNKWLVACMINEFLRLAGKSQMQDFG